MMNKKLKKATFGGPDEPIPGLWDSLPYIMNGQLMQQPTREVFNGSLAYDRFDGITPPIDNSTGASANKNYYNPFGDNSKQPDGTKSPKITHESKYQFGINYDNIFGSQVIQGIGSMLANNSQNSQGNAVKRFNQQYNNLPYTPNNSLQALYGMKKGGQVGMGHVCKYEDGGETMNDSDVLKWMDLDPMTSNNNIEEITTNTTEPTQEAADRVVKEVIEGTDEDKFNEIWSKMKEVQSYYQRMKTSGKYKLEDGGYTEGQEVELSPKEINALIKQGYKIKKLK